jgi:Tfp pilus assembly protein PilE
MANRVSRLLAANGGFTIVELMLAIFVLAVGVLTTFAVFGVSKRAIKVSELHETETHLAQKEIQRLQALPYSQVGMTSAPSHSTDPNNPGFYVSTTPSASCPSFQWNQSSGASNTAPVVVVGCGFPGDSQYTVPSQTTTTVNGVIYTINDFVTWVNNDTICLPGTGCPVNNAYKRVTVEVTNNLAAGNAPTSPVLISSVITDPHALPIVGNPNVNNPLNNPTITCTDGSGHTVSCNYGLGAQTPNTYYLTNTPEQNPYSPPTGDNSCMHYTDQQLPLVAGVLNCGGSSLGPCTGGSTPVLTGCPQPDLLNNAPPPSTILQEYNFSPNLSASTAGRVILRDTNATGSNPCSATPSRDARMAEWWATKPLSAQLNLSGNGGMTLYTNTLHGSSVNVTMCVGIYLESPALGILDPLNLLGSTDSIQLGVAAYTMAAWPAVPTPISFTFNNLFAAQAAAAGTSLAVRVWVAASSGDDIVVQYDAPTARSSVQINSQ